MADNPTPSRWPNGMGRLDLEIALNAIRRPISYLADWKAVGRLEHAAGLIEEALDELRKGTEDGF